jgi:hypothetical protein
MYPNKKIWDNARMQKQPIIILEVGGIQRGKTWKIGLNGVNRNGYFAPTGNTDIRKKKLGINAKPWRLEGEHILICCQHDKSEQWRNQDSISVWVEKTINNIRKYSLRKIVVRPHPRCPVKLNRSDVYLEKPIKLYSTHDDYDLNFRNAWAVVSHSSNPGPRAILAGVPAFVSPSSLAYPVGNTDYSLIESPLMLDRTQWLNDYAHTEHTLDEIRAGIPLNHILRKINGSYDDL